jgi:alkaline phosphatase
MKIFFRISLSIAFSIVLTFSSADVFAQKKSRNISKDERPKNIILLIGDGMGLPQVYAAMSASRDNLNISRLPHTAFVKTISADNYITDSAAAGTALACGVKTNNGMLGMLPDKSPVRSILHIAEDHGLATGLAVSCDVTHATPAAFIANVESRKMAQEIAMQYLDSGVDVFIGGGRENFNKRADSLNLLDSLIFRNYQVVSTIPAMMEVTSGKLAGILYPAHPPKYSEGRGDMLSIATSKAIELLVQNPKGFFLMVEGSQIDWGGHDNNIQYMLDETIDFDMAVGIALDFAEKNGETLVIVTADHETGGFTNLGGNFLTGEADGKFSAGDHSGTPVPVFTYGPGASHFEGFLDNTDIFKLMKKLFGFENALN